MVTGAEEQGDDAVADDAHHDQPSVDVGVGHHILLPVDIPADAVFRAHHLGGDEGNEGSGGAVKQAQEHVGHSGGDADLPEGVV